MLLLAALVIYTSGIISAAGCICWAALGMPWGLLQPLRRRIRDAFVAAGAVGFSACLVYAFVVYRQGLDGHWWPFVAAAWGSAWLVALSVALIIAKALALVVAGIRARRAERT
jgi:hypothetical protein